MDSPARPPQRQRSSHAHDIVTERLYRIIENEETPPALFCWRHSIAFIISAGRARLSSAKGGVSRDMQDRELQLGKQQRFSITTKRHRSHTILVL
jgi:hypothetical protein